MKCQRMMFRRNIRIGISEWPGFVRLTKPLKMRQQHGCNLNVVVDDLRFCEPGLGVEYFVQRA
jgi:hypothetical protein